MLKGLSLSNFMDTHEEWHAFIFGLCGVICPFPPGHKQMSEELQKQIREEYHYYLFGRATGILCWIGILKLVWEIL